LQRGLPAVDQHKLTADVVDEFLLASGAFGVERFALLDRERRGSAHTPFPFNFTSLSSSATVFA
jgi:hypothetical protein